MLVFKRVGGSWWDQRRQESLPNPSTQAPLPGPTPDTCPQPVAFLFENEFV